MSAFSLSPAPLEFSWFAFHEYFNACLQGPFLKQMRQAMIANGSKHSIGAHDSAALYSLVRIAQPKIVVETGTFRGVSASIIVQAMRDAGIGNGRVYTIDRERSAEIGSLIPNEFRDQITFLTGDVRQLQHDSRIPQTIDLFFHDSTHRYAHQKWEFEVFWPKIVNNGFLASHDVNTNASFSEFVTQSYAHTDGVVDMLKTTHSVWGRVGKFGFIRKWTA